MSNSTSKRVVADLADAVSALAARVERLERTAGTARISRTDAGVVDELIDDVTPLATQPDEEPIVAYASTGPWEDGTVVWKAARPWREVLVQASEPAPTLFSALGNPHRLRIVVALLGGRLTTAALTARLDQPSAGQLFHHLKDLLAAGVVHQPLRGTYAIRHQHVVPLLTLLSAAIDLAPPLPADA